MPWQWPMYVKQNFLIYFYEMNASFSALEDAPVAAQAEPSVFLDIVGIPVATPPALIVPFDDLPLAVLETAVPTSLDLDVLSLSINSVSLLLNDPAVDSLLTTPVLPAPSFDFPLSHLVVVDAEAPLGAV